MSECGALWCAVVSGAEPSEVEPSVAEPSEVEVNTKQTMKTNPFKFGKIVSDEYFYNREEELLKITRTLASGNNIALYAPRRYGKSSLIAKALNQLRKEGFLCVHFDFMSVYSQKTFIENYAKQILKSRKKSELQKVISTFASFVEGIKAGVSFDFAGNPEFSLSFLENRNKEESLIDVINLPESMADNNQKYIVAFDEFQEISKLNGENFEKILRSQIQTHKNVSYVFLGSKTHMLKDMFNNKNRAFYNSADIMNINKIESKKSVVFLKETFALSQIQVNDETATYLIEKADNIPYYIQFLAHQVWEKAIIRQLNTVDEDLINESLLDVLDYKDDYYWEITHNQSIHRKKLLLAISRDAKELYSDSTSRTYELGAASSTQKSLEVLINEGIIEKHNQHYDFSDPLYKMFIQKNL